MNILNGWRATVALPFEELLQEELLQHLRGRAIVGRATVVFKKCGEQASTEVVRAQYLWFDSSQ